MKRSRGGRFTFRIAVRCKELGVNHLLKALIGNLVGIKYEANEDEMRETASFIKDNKERIRKMLPVLADEESRRVWKVVMECRKQGKPIPEDCYSERNQYFVQDIVRLRDDEVFVDCGAYNGDTLQHLCNFAKKQGVSIKKMVAFEPDQENISQLRRNFKNDERICIIPKGVSDGEKMLRFLPDNTRGAFFNLDDSADDASTNERDFIKLPVTALDMQKECADATFIKMDIEGFEMAALRGAREIIRRNHPKLAICIYHSLEDMVEIIEYIHENFPEYDIYVRHHTKGYAETVMYAIMPE